MEYDVIIVGAGSAGAVLAARLTEDVDRSVLLLEAGPDYPELEMLPPDLADGLVASLDAHDWHLQAGVLEGRSVHYPRGKVVGGSSATNGVVAIRGTPEDYDDWAALGNPEWSWERCLPYFRRLETDRDFGGDYHGTNGPIPVVRWRREEWTPLQRAFFDACRESGYPESVDHNIPDATGAGSWAMNRAGTLRISTAIGYLQLARPRLNLTIRARCNVLRVLFDGCRATGVEVEHEGRVQSVFGREIVLAAGAIHSPAILLRSGVGPREQLDGLDIPLVRDLPGVGENLKDHPSVTLVAIPRAGVTSADEPMQQVGLRYTATGSAQANDMQMYIWGRRADRVPQVREDLVGAEPVFMLCVALQRPTSQGNLRLTNADPDAPPRIDLNLLATESDMERMVDGVRSAWSLLTSGPIAELTERLVSPTSATVFDEEQLRSFLRRRVNHLVHAVGTCKMGPGDDPLAVVDQFGRVQGLDALRVVDASVMPDLPRANTNLTTIMIGERVAHWMRSGN